MLYRMTVLRRPAEFEQLGLLGEQQEDEEQAHAIADRLRDTSLVEQFEYLVNAGEGQVRPVRRYGLHPATRQFVLDTHPEDPELIRAAHLRLGELLEVQAPESPHIETYLEAGYHLFEASEFDRAFEMLGSASAWLRHSSRLSRSLGNSGSWLGAFWQTLSSSPC